MKRNPDRFPMDFCFQLTEEEILRSQIAITMQTKGTKVVFPRRLLLADYQRRTRSLKVTNCYLYGKNARSQISPLRFYRAGDHRPCWGVSHPAVNGINN
ncbi:MAG: ORF6N domain-containing protein [Bacilli bacterium]|nr:ORF6N domain-containing protein [Bacilli bacterium]